MMRIYSECSTTSQNHHRKPDCTSGTDKVIYRTLLADLKSCRDLQWGRRIHEKAIECRQVSNIYIATALMRMYTKCGSILEAQHIFNSIRKPDVVCWNVLLSGYAENGQGLTALELFTSMKVDRCSPQSSTYIAIIKACTSLAVNADGSRLEFLKWGREIHSEMDQLDDCIQSTLINMYAKCGSLMEARRVFESIQNPDVVSWNVLLMGYAENGDGFAALDLFSKMKARRCAANTVTYIAAVRACTCIAVNGDGKFLNKGREIHSEIGCCHLGHYVQSALIEMYGKCRSMVEARSVFDSTHKPDLVCWTVLLLGYAENGEGFAALDLFWEMKACGCVPDSVTYVAAVKACTLNKNGDCLERGKQIHSEVSSSSSSRLNHYLQSALIDMYANFGRMKEARSVFDSIHKPNLACWNALLLGYAQNGEGLISLKLFSSMKAADSVTYVAAVKACTSEKCLEWGRKIHAEIGSSLLVNEYLQSSLVDMYAKCGSMVEAREVFGGIHKPDVVCWNALLMGCVENGEGGATLEYFSTMKPRPNSVTYIAVLKACGLIGDLTNGRKFQSEMKEWSPHVVTCLVDMYARCGSMREAREVFDLHANMREISTWNALLAGYGRLGESNQVFKVFKEMQNEGFKADGVSLVCMLWCCSHAGDVKKAMEYFEAMPTFYGIIPNVMHYACMVDSMGRANMLNEAVDLIEKMPYNVDEVMWMTVVGACRKWKNVDIGRWAFQCMNANANECISR